MCLHFKAAQLTPLANYMCNWKLKVMGINRSVSFSCKDDISAVEEPNFWPILWFLYTKKWGNCTKCSSKLTSIQHIESPSNSKTNVAKNCHTMVLSVHGRKRAYFLLSSLHYSCTEQNHPNCLILLKTHLFGLFHTYKKLDCDNLWKLLIVSGLKRLIKLKKLVQKCTNCEK